MGYGDGGPPAVDVALARLRLGWAVYWPESDLDAIADDVAGSPGRRLAWARLRGKAEALAIDRRGATAAAGDQAWAVRLHRMADALSA